MLLILALLLLPIHAFDIRSKRGLAWPNANWVPMGGFTSPTSRISSYYNWTPTPLTPSSSPGTQWLNPFPFIPMLWGCTAAHEADFLSSLQRNWDGRNLTSHRAVLGFNEPDLAAQANCTPQQGADVWRRVLQPLKKQGYRVGSPAVTNGPDGQRWLTDWWAACQGGCDPDFMTIHWYDVDVGRFMNHIKDYRAAYNRPVWVTEYAPTNFTFSSSGTLIGTQPTYPQIQRFMDVTNAWMDGVDWIERYFWFGAMYEMQGVTDFATLLDPKGKGQRTGALSELGVQYAGTDGSVTGSALRATGSSRPRWESGAKAGYRRSKEYLSWVKVGCLFVIGVLDMILRL